MARKIDQERCIRCGACLPECPNEGISEKGGEFVIDAAWCTECFGVAGSPQCAAVCPVDAVAKDEKDKATEDELIERSAALHPDRFRRD
ncbi:MAG: 4Fe-4S binding protein [Verrucomicrobiota bacterium]